MTSSSFKNFDLKLVEIIISQDKKKESKPRPKKLFYLPKYHIRKKKRYIYRRSVVPSQNSRYQTCLDLPSFNKKVKTWTKRYATSPRSQLLHFFLSRKQIKGQARIFQNPFKKTSITLLFQKPRNPFLPLTSPRPWSTFSPASRPT